MRRDAGDAISAEGAGAAVASRLPLTVLSMILAVRDVDLRRARVQREGPRRRRVAAPPFPVWLLLTVQSMIATFRYWI